MQATAVRSKSCIRCGSSGPFYKDSSRSDGLTSRCASCCYEQSKSWREKNRPKARVHGRTHARRKRTVQGALHTSTYAYKKQSPKIMDAQRASVQKRRATLVGAYVEPVYMSVVVKRDQGICGICKKRVMAAERSIDHIIPLARGGLHRMSNVQLAHRVCNTRKGVS
jgi:5-methylcytosine-specific restriction endonuclease McrA